MAVRDDFSAGEVLAAADLNDTFASKLDASAPVGKILQVVSGGRTTPFTTTSTSFVDVTDVSVSITPSAATSKIFIILTGVIANNNSGTISLVNLVRDSTAIAQSTGGASADQSLAVYTANASSNSGFAVHWLDSPATTSATTYKAQLRIPTGSATASLGRYASSGNYPTPTTLTVMEVGA